MDLKERLDNLKTEAWIKNVMRVLGLTREEAEQKWRDINGLVDTCAKCGRWANFDKGDCECGYHPELN